jgi:5-formyltetrahydrofolate cyclo-ligase
MSITTALPVIDGNNLHFCPFESEQQLSTGPFGILQPVFLPEHSLRPDLLLLPLLAFDGHGTRLGYGGGYYDRYLQQRRSEKTPCLAIGLAYEAQRSAQNLPRDIFDQHLDGVLTEKAFIAYDRKS